MITKCIASIFLAIAVMLLSGCGGGGGSGTASGSLPNTDTVSSGVAQKGPLLLGSTVTVQELDANLSPIGKQYSYQIDSDLGTFSPTSTFTSQYLGISATGYYFDEVTNGISAGTVTLNGVSDLSTDSTLNVNLLTTLAYQRIKKLVNESGMTVAAARSQAEQEVLAAFGIRNSNLYGNFGSLDISKHRDGDNILAALSSIFVYGNSSGALSSLIANFQLDIADNGVLDDAATKSALTTAAMNVNPVVIAANLSQKYGTSYSAADIGNWIDQNGDGLLGTFEYQVPDATPTSTFTFPASIVDQVVGAPVSVTTGQLLINGSPIFGTVTVNKGDVIAVTPATGSPFPSGVITTNLVSGTAKIAKVSFVSSLQSITVTPATPSQPSGMTQQFVATGTFSDTSTADMTTNVTWVSSAPSIVSINPSSGLAYGAVPGIATITARSGKVVSNAATYTVTPAVLQSIAITPNPLYTGIGITRQFKATGTYSDGIVADITMSVTWSSADTGIATVNAASGLVTGVVLGATTITATSNAVTSSATLNVIANSWSSAGNLATGRHHHTATLLANGKVLVAGGYVSTGSPSSAELYDPATNSWSSAGNLAIVRISHTATLLPNGKVLVVGGSVSKGSPSSAELYDPASNSWSSAGNLVTDRTSHTATLLPNGKVLVVGGYVSTGSSSSAELYDPSTNSWSTAGSLATGRSLHTATLLPNGRVLVAGGANSGSGLVLSAELYDPATNLWSSAGNLATERCCFAATLLPNGKVLVVGGYLGSGISVASADLYDPVTNSWSSAGSLATGRYDHTATLLPNGKVLVVGGFSAVTLSRTELYDPSTNSWSSVANLATGRSHHTATLLTNGIVLVVGGVGVTNAELYWQ